MKKIISMLLITVILFNFILSNYSYADESDSVFQGESSINQKSVTGKDQNDIMNSKTEDKSGTMGDQTIGMDLLGAIFGTIAGAIFAALNIFPTLILCCISSIAETDGLFTIEKAVFNEISLFNIDFFNFDGEYEIGTGENAKKISFNGLNKSEIPSTVRKSISKYYIILRLISMTLSLIVLIYVGIRMALSTISSDKAKYKEMLMAWVESIILLFLMQYIISLIIGIGKIFGNICYDLRAVLAVDGVGFEEEIMNTMTSNMLGNSGWAYVAHTIPFWFLIFIQTKFFLAYFKRFITVGFLILISPIITVTYPIDKVGDGKAQAFSVWLAELGINVFIQPIHALIYLVFMYTAGEIARKSILVAIVFLLALTKVEKIVLQLFNLRNVTSLAPVDEQRKK